MDTLVRSVLLSLAGFTYAFGTVETTLSILLLFALCAGQGLRAMGLVSAFYAIALSPIAMAAWDYSGSMVWTLIAWCMPLTLNAVVVGAALSAKRPGWRALYVVCALALLHSPLLAGVSVITPLSVAGLLFPGTGWVGVMLVVLLIVVLCVVVDLRLGAAYRMIAGLNAVGVCFIVASASSAAATQTVSPVIGIDTQRGMPDAMTAAAFSSAWREREVQQAIASGAAKVVFPESTLGDVARDVALRPNTLGVEILRGARLIRDEHRYQHILISNRRGIVYRQRHALPLSLGQLRRSIAGPVLTPEQHSIDALICVELANPWLTLTTFARAEREVIWVANLGWSQNRSLEQRLLSELYLWSRLFNKPIVTAINHRQVPRV